MESPINLSCDPPLKSAENIANSSSSSSSSLSSSVSSSSSLQARPSRFRYPLVSLKRLRTLGPARRVLVSDTEVDNSLPKISEEENDIAQKKTCSDEDIHVEVGAESPSTGNCSLQQEKAVPGLGPSCAFGGIVAKNYEHQEPRKRKADIETMAEDATISLTVNMESSTSPSENNSNLRLGQKECDYIGTGEFDSVGIAHKSMAEHNISVNRHSSHYDAVKLHSSNADIEEAACSKIHLKQLQKLDIASLGSDHLKPIIQDGPKKVHFANVDLNRVGSVEFPTIIETEHKRAHSTLDNQQVVLNSRSSLEVSTDDRSAPSSSSIKDDSIHSKHYPALMSEHKNKETVVRRGQFVDYDLALGSTDFLKSECNFSNVDVKPSMSYRTHVSSTKEANRLLDSLSSTPLVSVDSESCEKLITDSHVENLSSHLNSLALTENQGNGSLRKLGESFHTHLENLKQSGLSNASKFQSSILKEVQSSKTNVASTAAAAIDDILKPSVNYYSRVEVNNSSTLPATADLSCRASSFCVSNSASIQCTSALSSLSSFQNHGPCKDLTSAREKGTVRESSSNSRLGGQNSGFDDSERHFNLNINNSSGSSACAFTCTSSSFACQSATSIRCTSGPLTSLSAGHGLNMSREHSGTVKANTGKSLSEGPNDVKVREPPVLTKSVEDRVSQEPSLASRTNEARGQVPEVASVLNKSVNQSACEGDSEKALGASNKETNNSRRKHYDPDAFFRVNNKIYQKLGKIGSGGSSEVHKVISSDCTIYALKKIKLKGRDYSTAYGFCQEIDYLTRLRGKNYIIQLIDYEVTDKNLFRDVVQGNSKIRDGKINEDAYMYMVLEYGEIDLAQMLLQKWREMDSGNKQIDENWLRFYWQQILKAVNTIHEERIVHSDLKPANFLLVKGVLKLIDFGIAKAIQSDTTNIQRDAQVGTLNYMSPEAFLCNDQDEDGNIIKCGRSSDIWSLGCILYQMVYGRTPFAEYTTFWAKYKEITNKNHKITYGQVSNPWLLDIMKKCLVWDRHERLRIPQLLEHPFLQPQAPPLLLTQEQCHCNALVEISDAYESNSEIRRLCEKLLLDIMKKSLACGRNERLGIPQLPEHSFLQPEAAPRLLAQEERHCKDLVKISNDYESDSEICRLCKKLQEQIRNLSKSLKSNVFHAQFTLM